MSKRWFPLVVTLALVLASKPEVAAQDKQLKKINWGVTSLSAGNWIPWIAKEAKIYEKHGLDVQLILLRGSGQTSAAMLGGSIFASPVTLTTMIMADLSGADFVNIAHTVAAVNTKLLVRPEIKRVEDLKGKRVGITSLGSLSDFLLKHTFRKYGLDPNRDVTWLMIGTPPERLQALISGTVDASEASYPIDAQGEKKGYRVLLDLRKEVSYPSMSVVTRRKTIVEDRDTVARMIRAHVEGIAYFKQNKEVSMRVLGKALKITDREMLETSYETYKQDFISVPYPITKGLEATYDFIAQTRPEVRSRKPEEFVDTSFIAELEKSGFIKKLYEAK
ncbi:MAG: ABC transporter substrate-binding protein [Deltaproteobacteria bacterium]|nr:ABC transporter substrate-binding protein [Deltaproteobacteria bacterium]